MVFQHLIQDLTRLACRGALLLILALCFSLAGCPATLKQQAADQQQPTSDLAPGSDSISVEDFMQDLGAAADGPAPDPLPSDETYYIEDHTAGTAEQALLSGETVSSWSLVATKATADEIETHVVTLTSENSATRACTLRFRLPLSRTDLVWHKEDLKTVVPIAESGVYRNDISQGYQDHLGPNTHRVSSVPWGGVSTNIKGWALGVDVYHPVSYQIAYDSGTQSFYIQFFLGFHTSKRTATVKFHFWNFDPVNGARQIVSDYQNRVAPLAFRSRWVERGKRHGSWLFNSTKPEKGGILPTTSDADDFGWSVHQGWAPAATIPTIYTSERVFNLAYLFSYESFIPGIQDENTQTYNQVLAKIQQKADAGDLRCQAAINSSVSNSDGQHLLYLDNPWTPADWVNTIVNVSPHVRPVPNDHTAEFETRVRDGMLIPQFNGVMRDNNPYWIWTNFSGSNRTRINYREEHFQYSKYPLTFDTSFRVGIFYESMAAEGFEGISEWCWNQTKFHPVITNGGAPYGSFTFPHADMCGGEVSWLKADGYKPAAEYGLLERLMKAGKKPVMLIQNPSAWTSWTATHTTKMLARCACFGAFPSMGKDGLGGVAGGFYHQYGKEAYIERDRPIFRKYMPVIRAISEAGWQPVRNFTMSDASIWGERFGHISGSNKTVYLTCFNPSTTSSATFILSSAAYSTGVAEFKELLSNTNQTWSSGTISVTLGPEQANVFKITLN